MSQQIKEFEKLIAEKSEITPKEIWAKISDFLYKKNNDGTFILKDGKKVLNWVNILLRVGTLIALLVQRIQIYEQPVIEPTEPIVTKPTAEPEPVTTEPEPEIKTKPKKTTPKE